MWIVVKLDRSGNNNEERSAGAGEMVRGQDSLLCNHEDPNLDFGICVKILGPQHQSSGE